MKILTNTDKTKAEFFSRVTNHEFAPVSVKGGEVAILLPEASFDKDLDEVLILGVPVVVIAGKPDSDVVAKARDAGIPDECVLIKQENQTTSINGSVRYGNAKRGIPIRAAVKAAEKAVKENLYPEILIWQEPQAEAGMPFDEPAWVEEPAQAKAKEPVHVKPSEKDIYALANEVISVFRTVPGANTGRVAFDVARHKDGVHLELSSEPASWTYYGQTFEKAVNSGKYLYFNGAKISGRYPGSRVLVVEVDPLLPSPEALDEAYQKAHKVIHVASGAKESVEALTAWVKSGWKLDAVLAESTETYNAVRSIVNAKACASVDELLKKI